MPFDAQDVGGHYSIVITSMSMLHFCEYAVRRVVEQAAAGRQEGTDPEQQVEADRPPMGLHANVLVTHEAASAQGDSATPATRDLLASKTHRPRLPQLRTGRSSSVHHREAPLWITRG